MNGPSRICTAPSFWNCIVLTGPDAQDFLHRLTTANVKHMKVGEGSLGCALNAQGTIQGFFSLWRFTEQDFALEFDSGASGTMKESLLSFINLYTFAEKFTVTELTQLHCAWVFPGGPDTKSFTTEATDEEIRLCHWGAQTYGRNWITAWGREPCLQKFLDREYSNALAISEEELERWRVEAAFPRSSKEITSQVNPLEIGLFAAIAQNKGCYPGQEVIEKILAIGSPARRLVKIKGAGIRPEPNTPLFNSAEPPSEIGRVTSSVQSDQDFLSLALIRKIHAREGNELRLADSRSAKIQAVTPYDR